MKINMFLRRHCITLIFAGTILLFAATMNAQAQYNYTILSVPGTALGISGNNIVGYDGNSENSFLYNGSSYTTLSVPGAIETEATGISGNNMVGSYETPGVNGIGFLYNGSSYTSLSVPGASVTEAVGISGNNIVGNYYNGSWQSFLYNGTSYITLSVPGAEQTWAEGIDGNNIVGYYTTASGQQSFLATPVPEPSVLGLLAIGITALLVQGLSDRIFSERRKRASRRADLLLKYAVE